MRPEDSGDILDEAESHSLTLRFTACRELLRLLHRLGIRRWRHPGSKALLDYSRCYGCDRTK